MTDDTPEIAAARIAVERARAQMFETARELQSELIEMFSPHTWARDIWEGAKEKGADLAEDAVDAVRNRPAVAGGVLAAIALFFAREPLIDMAGKLADGVGTKRKARKSRKKAAAAAPRTKQKNTETIE